MRRIAIHAHVFYPDIWPEIRCCIGNLVSVFRPKNSFLHITYPREFENLRGLFDGYDPGCGLRITAVQNRGYDMCPFLVEFLNGIDLSDYDYIAKLHTKRDTERVWINYRPFSGPEWRRALLSFCADAGAVSRTIASFESFPKLGMIANHKFINYCGSDRNAMAREAFGIAKRDFSLPAGRMVVVSGSVFCVRAELLRVVQGKFSECDFQMVGDGVRVHKDYGFAGVMEFLIPMLVDAQGFIVSEGRFPERAARAGYFLKNMLYRSLRLASDAMRRLAGNDRFDRLLGLVRLVP